MARKCENLRSNSSHEQRRIEDFFKEGVVMRVQGKRPRASGGNEGGGGGGGGNV